MLYYNNIQFKYIQVIHIFYVWFYSDSSCESIFLDDLDHERENDSGGRAEETDFEVALKKLLAHFITHKLTFECLENTAKIMNEMPGATLKLPTTKFTLMKAFNSLCSCDHRFYIHCETCKIYTKCFPGDYDSWACEKCKKNLKLSEINYIVYIMLEQQLKKILEKHWDQFIAYNDVIVNDESPNIEDTYSGAFVEAALKKTVIY